MDTQKKIDILVIDDNVDQLNWFKLLNGPTSPFQFHTLQNEMNAAPTLEKIKPQVIFLDNALNVLDGPLIATILNGNNFDSSRIIPMSAEGRNKNAINADNFLQKPLTKEIVFNKIKSVLKINE